jgi:hypothetical protein
VLLAALDKVGIAMDLQGSAVRPYRMVYLVQVMRSVPYMYRIREQLGPSEGHHGVRCTLVAVINSTSFTCITRTINSPGPRCALSLFGLSPLTFTKTFLEAAVYSSTVGPRLDEPIDLSRLESLDEVSCGQARSTQLDSQ